MNAPLATGGSAPCDSRPEIDCIRLLPDAACVLDSKGFVVRLNDSMRAFFGQPSELRHQRLEEFAPPAGMAQTHDALQQLMRGTSRVVDWRTEWRQHDGSVVFLSWSARKDAELDLIVCTARDITEERALTQRYRSVVEAAPAGLLTIDPEGRIVLANHQVEVLFGYSQDELLDMSVDDLVPEHMRTSHPKKRRRFGTQPTERRMGQGRNLYGQRKDGTQFPLEVGLSPLATPLGHFVHCSVIDVSERMRHEEDLHQRVTALQRHQEETELLGEMSSLLQHAVCEDEAIAIVSEYCGSLFQETRVGIYILPPSGDALERVAACSGFSGAERLATTDCWALRRSLVHRNHRGKAARCPHVRRDDELALCIPMSAHGHSLGMVTISMADGRSDEQLNGLSALARSVADQFGLALSNLQLRSRLQELSIRDPLTGLFNRRYLEETAVREFARAERHGAPICVLMLDVDHFKAFNDAHGHQAADDMLRRLARSLKEGTRTEDVPCRYGGEEFVVLLPNADPEAVARRADELRQIIHDRSSKMITVSAGVSTYPRDGASWDAVLRAADTALYQAKQSGRNRTVVWQEEAPRVPT